MAVGGYLFFVVAIALIVYGIGWLLNWWVEPDKKLIKFKANLSKAKRFRQTNSKISEDVKEFKENK